MTSLTLTRRRLLAGIGATTGTAALAGCGGQTQEQGQRQRYSPIDAGEISTVISPEDHAQRFSEVVNLVHNFGADPTGEEPIDGPLREAWGNDRLIVIPEGEYTMNRSLRQTNTSNVGLIGQNAIIRHGSVEAINQHSVDRGEYSGGTMMFRIGTSMDPHGDLLFGGFIFDWSWSENAGMQALNAFIDGEAEIRNIRFEGVHSLGTHGNMRAAAGSPESVVLVENIDMSDGGVHFRDTINTRTTRRFGGYTDELDFGQSWSTTGMTGHPDQQGTTIFRNVISGPWPDNAIYVRGGSGRKIVSNCVAWNGGGCQIRTNGGNDWEPVEWLDRTQDKNEALNGEYPGSVVENSQCIVTEKPNGVYVTPRGLLLQDGPQIVRNCEIDIEFAEGGGAGGTYGLGTRGEDGEAPAGPAVFEDCTITLHENTNAVYVSPHSNTIELQDIEINTVGWESGLDRLLGGHAADQVENVIVNPN